jgi:hypothetical protein
VPDYIADFAEVIRRGNGSDLKRDRLIRKLEKFRRACKEAGADVSGHPQRQFVEALCADGHGDFEELMAQLCFARLVRGDFSDWSGWQFRNEWAKSSYAAELQPKRWKGQPGSLAVLGEQGIGDEIMFASCIPDAKRLAEVVVECDPRLQGVFERSLNVKTRPRADIVDRDSNKYLTQERAEDWFLPMGDLPRLFRRSRNAFPAEAYLTPLPEYVAKWSHLKGRTGIAWRGRTGKTEPEAFGVENPVCLQYDAWEFETEGMTVPDCDLKNDIEDLLGICANLEKVVSTTQTIVHIAGSIGTRVDVVLPPKGSSRVENAIPYRYIDPMPWYPNVRVHASLSSYRRSRS